MKKKIFSKGNLPSMLSMDHPAFYQIRVQGRLDQIWSERLAGTSVTTTGGKDIPASTMLERRRLDQAALIVSEQGNHDPTHAVV